MLPIFVYLLNTFHHPRAIPDSLVLAQRLADLGFGEHEIVLALDCLMELKTLEAADLVKIASPSAHFFRIYTQQEQELLGSDVIVRITSLFNSGLISFEQRELIIEQAFAFGEVPISAENFRALLLMLLWSQNSDQMQLYKWASEECSQTPLH